jgi:hypothetical protein
MRHTGGPNWQLFTGSILGVNENEALRGGEGPSLSKVNGWVLLKFKRTAKGIFDQAIGQAQVRTHRIGSSRKVHRDCPQGY